MMKKLWNFNSEVYKLLTITPTKAMGAFKLNKDWNVVVPCADL
jgi:hypothetical protein